MIFPRCMNSLRDWRLLNIPSPLVDTPVFYFVLLRNLFISYFSVPLRVSSLGKTFTNVWDILLVIRNPQRSETVGFFESFHLDVVVIYGTVLPMQTQFEKLSIIFGCVTGFRLTFIDWRQVASLGDLYRAVYKRLLWDLVAEERFLPWWRFQIIW